MAFMPNPENKRTVNHKNSIRKDNRVENLEWNTHSENAIHGYDVGFRKLPRAIGVCLIKDMAIIEYDSIHKMEMETGIRHEQVKRYANTDVEIKGYRIAI